MCTMIQEYLSFMYNKFIQELLIQYLWQIADTPHIMNAYLFAAMC